MANKQTKRSKLVVLGTANFGLKKYGINEIKLTNKNKNKILNYALNKNISYFDTAYSYDSEKFLNLKKIKIFTKLKPIKENLKFNDKNSLEEFIKDSINNSLKKLKTKSIYCLMLHRVEDININNQDVIAILNKYKKKGLIKNIGVSINLYKNISIIAKNKLIKYIQLPINIYDQRWKIFFSSDLKSFSKSKKFIARSIFLQGIFNKNYWPKKIRKQKKLTNDINIKLLNKLKIDNINELMIRYVNSLKEIDYILFGVTKIHTINTNLNYLSKEKFSQNKLDIIEDSTFNVKKEFYDIINWSN